jgi:hypothetical protein
VRRHRLGVVVPELRPGALRRAIDVFADDPHAAPAYAPYLSQFAAMYARDEFERRVRRALGRPRPEHDLRTSPPQRTSVSDF